MSENREAVVDHNIVDQAAYLDVAIVGGGIGGTYTGWRLRDRGWSIGIFESTGRIGGRIFNVTLPSVPNVPIHLGATRYLPGRHSKLEGLLENLGLLSEIYQPDQYEKLYYFRGQRMTSEDLESDKLPFRLAPDESRNPAKLRWQLCQRLLNSKSPDQIENLEGAVSSDGVPLYLQDYVSAMDKVWSSEARQYLKECSMFRTFYEPTMNSLHCVLPENPNSSEPVPRTVAGGMGLITERLRTEFLTSGIRHSIHLNRRVNSIRKITLNGKDVYELRLSRTITERGYTKDLEGEAEIVYAEQVILTVASPALRKINWPPFQQNPAIQSTLGAVADYTAIKIFLVYPNAWWDKTGGMRKAFITDLPVRQGSEIGRYRDPSGREKAVLLATYTDVQENTDYWLKLRNSTDVTSSSAVPEALSVSRAVVERVHEQLQAIFGVSSAEIPSPIDGVMQVWDDNNNGGGWQYVKPGFKQKTLLKAMRKPSASDRVFSVTNSFSSLSDWVEGSLREADEILRQFFQ